MFGFKPPEKEDCSKLPEDDEKTTRLIALARCNCLMNRYLRWKKRNHLKSDLFRGVALVFTAITPVLLLLPMGIENVKILGAAASAVAAIATGLLSITGWRENYVRYGYIWHALQSEKYRYLTHATKEYSASDEEAAAKKFACRIEQLVMADVTDWRDEMQRVGQQQQTGGA
jgi:hypothetical protein